MVPLLRMSCLLSFWISAEVGSQALHCTTTVRGLLMLGYKHIQTISSKNYSGDSLCDRQLFITSGVNALGVYVLASVMNKPSHICHGHHTRSPWHRKNQLHFLRKLNKTRTPKTVQYRYLLYSKEKQQTHPGEKHLKQAWFVHGPRLGSRITCGFGRSNLCFIM